MKTIITIDQDHLDILMRHLQVASREILEVSGAKLRIRFEEDQDARQPTRSKGSRVVYQLVGEAQLTGVKETIRLFLLTKGPSSAHVIEQGTGLGRKSVESALHGMRHEGVVRSQA